MSGVDFADGRRIRKGAPDAVIAFVRAKAGTIPAGLQQTVDAIASKGATPLVVAEDSKIAGVVVLEDILKPGMSERFERLRRMGLRTVMITGDNPLTAATIAKQAGVDDFVAQATPESKLAYIRKEQAEGKLVAMMGDGTNDAPALAQADVGARDEFRDPGGQGSRQHGRPRFRSDQADRSGRDRKATADDARRADDLFSRQRRGQVFRDRSRAIRRHASMAEGDGHHASSFADVRDTVRGYLQRRDHPGPDSGCAERRQVSAARRRCAAAQEPSRLGRWRRHSSLHRNQADRCRMAAMHMVA